MLKKMIMDRSIIPQINNNIELTKLEVQNDINNNIEVNYIDGGSSPLLKLELVYNAGSKYQSQPLIASLAFDLLHDGSKRVNGKSFKEVINGLGVYYGMDISKDFGTLSFYVLERNLKQLLDLVKDVITNPNLSEDEFNRLLQKEKNDFLIDSEKTSFLARQKFAESIFNGSEYGHVAHLEDFDKIGYQMAKSFVYEHVVKSPFQLLISGNISDSSKYFVKLFLESLEISSLGSKKKVKECSPIKQLHTVKKDSEQCSIMMGKLLPSKMHPDYHKLSISNNLLGGYFGSRLMQNIREDKGWTYGIHSSILNYQDTTSLVISTDVLKDKGDETINEIKKEIEKLQSELIPEKELDILKNYLKGNLLKGFDGAFEQIDRFFSVDSFGLDWSYYDAYIKTLETISPEEIKEICCQYLKWEDFVLVKVGGN
jgi:predicted Zn-dependent peptidase